MKHIMQATPTTTKNGMHDAIAELQVALTTPSPAPPPLRWINDNEMSENLNKFHFLFSTNDECNIQINGQKIKKCISIYLS